MSSTQDDNDDPSDNYLDVPQPLVPQDQTSSSTTTTEPTSEAFQSNQIQTSFISSTTIYFIGKINSKL